MNTNTARSLDETMKVVSCARASAGSSWAHNQSSRQHGSDVVVEIGDDHVKGAESLCLGEAQ